MNGYYPADASVGLTTACFDGYAEGGKCIVSCPRGKWGYARYNVRGDVDQSNCDVCNSNCYTCRGPNSDECTSCKSGYYLNFYGQKTYGTCNPKSGTSSYTVYVNNFVNPNTKYSSGQEQTITGTVGDSFGTIMDAMTKAYEWSAPYAQADITIVLKSGSHSMLRTEYNYYMPYANDDWSQHIKLTIQSEAPGTPVTVFYKMRDKFQFKVGRGLTIKDVIFEGLDSIVDPKNDPNGVVRNHGQFCTVSGSTLGGDPACAFVRKP